MLNIKSYQDFEEIMKNKIDFKGVMFGVGVTAFMRFFPGLFVNNYKIITFKDSSDNPILRNYVDEIFILKHIKPDIKLPFYNTNNILRNALVRNYIKKHQEKKYLFLYKSDNNIEKAVKDLNVKIIANKAKLNKLFENKVNFRKQLAAAGLEPILGETMKFTDFLLPEHNYEFFTEKYGTKFVFQLPDFRLGGGKGTEFIDSKRKFNAFKKKTETGRYKGKDLETINITKFIEGKSCSVACCATKYGTLTTRIQQQIMDIPQVISKKKGNGLFVGHVFGLDLNPELEKQAQDIAINFGDYMYKKGYKGIFGLDLIVNEKENKVYPVECNARYTGAFPMVSMLHMKHKIIPLDLFHLLEFFKIPYKINVKELNKMYQKDIQGSHIILSNIRKYSIEVKNSLDVGVYHYLPRQKKIDYWQSSIFYEDLKNDTDFILVDGVPKKGDKIKKYNRIARITHVLFNGNIMKNNKELKDKYLQIIYAIYKAMFGRKQP